MAVIPGYVPQVGERDLQKMNRAIRNLYEGAALASDVTALTTRITTAEGEIDTLQTDVTALEALANDRTGEFFWYFADNPPSFALVCDGGAVSRTTYAALWTFAQASGNLAASEGAKLAGEFGPGNGSTTFTLPDLVTSRYFIRSKGTGRAVGSVQTQGTAKNGLSATTTAAAISGIQQLNEAGNLALLRSDGGAGTVTISSTDTETRPVNVALLPCVVF